VTSEFAAPRQDRSRETQARLLKATIEVLEAHGLEGATIPRIAEAAGVAPASVYRRFRDRDALLRAAITAALQSSRESNQANLRLDAFKDRTLTGVVRALVGAQIHQYRAAPGLMRAFIRFAEQDKDDTFRETAISSIGGNFETLIDLLTEFRSEIAHPEPKRALMFSLLTTATVIEAIEVDEVSMWHHLLPLSDSQLQDELTRMTLAYLRG
jgi:AcrR family transcriptional regulator